MSSGRVHCILSPVKIVGIVPAKGHSTRVPGKNRRQLGDLPLFAWAANNLARVLGPDAVYVDSDDPETRALAEALGFRSLVRPDDLATNATDGNQLMLWAASQIEADVYVQNLPPMPFLSPASVRAGLEAVRGGASSALGVRREKLYLWTERGPTYDLRAIPNSFTLPDTIIEGMGFYVMRREALLEHEVRAAEPRALIELSPFEAVDIDHEVDLELAQTIAAGLPSDHPLRLGIPELRERFRRSRLPSGPDGGPARIGLLALDIDGVMTDGGMYVSERGDELKKFNTKDGMAIKHLVRTGTEVAFVSSSTHRAIIDARAQRLEVRRVHAGKGHKHEIVDAWRRELGLRWDEVAFVGDDVNDLPVLREVGLSACPADATEAVRREVTVVLDRPGGGGCVRELVDRFLAEDIEHHQ